MRTVAELVAKWESRHEEWRRLGVQVNGALLADEVLADLHELSRANALDPVSLGEASLISGYSIDHLQRLVAAGKLENIGKKGRPRIRRGDLPVKPGHRLPSSDGEGSFNSRRRIVASVTNGNEAS